MAVTANYAEDGRILAPGLTPPPSDTHKYRRGSVLVFSGPKLATGASRLAAEAALRIGAGLVTIVGNSEALEEHAAHVTAIMLREEGEGDPLSDARTGAVVVGPGAGGGETTRARVERILARGCPVVLDADALTSFADRPESLFAMLHDGCVLTPHEGEFARLFPGIAIDDRREATKAAAEHAQCTVLLKGPVTHISGEKGQAVYNDHASPWLATAGSGDTLAGMIAGLLAQGAQPMDAAAMASWCHGEAGIRGGAGLIADDIAAILPSILDDLLSSHRA